MSHCLTDFSAGYDVTLPSMLHWYHSAALTAEARNSVPLRQPTTQKYGLYVAYPAPPVRFSERLILARLPLFSSHWFTWRISYRRNETRGRSCRARPRRVSKEVPFSHFVASSVGSDFKYSTTSIFSWTVSPKVNLVL
jgi:hypothetical protein